MMERHYWKWSLFILWFSSNLGAEGTSTTQVLDDLAQFIEDIRDTINTFAGVDKSEVIENVKTIRRDIHQKISELRTGDQALDPMIIEAEENLSKFGVDAMTILLKLLDEDAATNNVEISKLIISFKRKLRSENLRILLLPRGSIEPPSNEDCPSCQIFSEIKMYLERNTNPPPISFTDLNLVSETINAKITELVESNKKGCYRDQLETLLEIRNGKNGRDGIEEVITNMREKAEDEVALKNLIERSLKRIINDVDNDHTRCMARVRTSTPTANCLQERLQGVIKIMKKLRKKLDNEKAEINLVKKNVGNELLEFINRNNDISLEVLESKFNNKEFDRCEESWSKLFQDSLRVPMYNTYNKARSANYRPCSICETALEKSIDDNIESWEKLMQSEEVKNPAILRLSTLSSTSSSSTCEVGEYEQTKQYLEQVDNIIHDSLLSRERGTARLGALVGFVTIQRLLTEREEKMHEDQLVVKCPKEVTNIRTQYMAVLGECMQKLFDKKDAEFDKQTRKEKISCAERLRGKMENRFGQLYSAVFSLSSPAE